MKSPLRRWLVAILCVLSVFPTRAQGVRLLSPRDLGRWHIPSGNYSGITPLGNGRYAVVSDKEIRDGFFVFRIVQDSLTGQVKEVFDEGFRGVPSRSKGGCDAEGVAFMPEEALVWISGEADQRIQAHHLDGTVADRELLVPELMSRTAIAANYGFEALCYDDETKLFWVMTENVLKADGPPASPGDTVPSCLRLQSFGRDGQPVASYAYTLDLPQASGKGRLYAFGAVEVCPVGEGALWVMERELQVPHRRLRASTHLKIYEVFPTEAKGLTEDAPSASLAEKALSKRLVADFSTRMRLFRPKLANFEGLCESIRLADGRRTWLLMSDSQGGYGRKFCHLRDWIRVLVSP